MKTLFSLSAVLVLMVPLLSGCGNSSELKDAKSTFKPDFIALTALENSMENEAGIRIRYDIPSLGEVDRAWIDPEIRERFPVFAPPYLTISDRLVKLRHFIAQIDRFLSEHENLKNTPLERRYKKVKEALEAGIREDKEEFPGAEHKEPEYNQEQKIQYDKDQGTIANLLSELKKHGVKFDVTYHPETKTFEVAFASDFESSEEIDNLLESFLETAKSYSVLIDSVGDALLSDVLAQQITLVEDRLAP